jgi:hypothetical protein
MTVLPDVPQDELCEHQIHGDTHKRTRDETAACEPQQRQTPCVVHAHVQSYANAGTPVSNGPFLSIESQTTVRTRAGFPS